MALIFNKIRIQLFSNDIIRLEYNKDKCFFDGQSLFIINRDALIEDNDYSIKKENGYYIISYKEVNIYLKESGISLKGTFIKDNNSKVIYKYRPLLNQGELPPVNHTPEVFPLSDNPRIIIPPAGYSYDEHGEPFVVEENCEDVYLILARKNHRLLRKRYVELTGRNELVRLSTLGLWNSKYYEYDEESAKQVILDYRKYRVPLDNLVIDTDWRKSSERGIGYEVNDKLFPDLKRFFDFAHHNNIEIMFNDHPEPLEGASSVLDPKEIKFREEKLQAIMKLGLDYWWYDRNWITKLKSPTTFINPETFGFYAFYEITKNFYLSKAHNHNIYTRPIIMGNVNDIRNGDYIKIFDSASHRYAMQWTGDIGCDFDSMKIELGNLIRGSENEIAYINFDCGGHVGNPSKNLYLRWIELGCLSPILRPHCTKDVAYSREPWVYDHQTLIKARNYINMRYNLLPYLYRNGFKNYLDGEPLIKSLVYEYPNDKKAKKITDEFIVGKNLLVAPIYDSVVNKLKANNYAQKVKATYYLGTELEGEAIYQCEYDVLDQYYNNSSPHESIPVYDYSARFITDLCFDEDITLVIASDDGVRIYLDGKMVFDDWNCHAFVKTDICLLKANQRYHLEIEYFQKGGDAGICLYYRRRFIENRRQIYLPEGRWMNVFDGKIYLGKKSFTREYPVEVLPLFVRLGSLIPLAKKAMNTALQHWNQLIYDFYPDIDAIDEDYLYEDDTKTTAYKYHQYRLSPYSQHFDKEANCFVITFKKAQGDFKGKKAYKSRKIKLKYHLLKGVDKILKVTLNNELISPSIYERKRNAFPFNDTNFAKDSQVLLIEFEMDVKQDYIIKIYIDRD